MIVTAGLTFLSQITAFGTPPRSPVVPFTRFLTTVLPVYTKDFPIHSFITIAMGTFADVSIPSGIRGAIGKGMGVGVADFDDDGWPDIFVANDTLPNSFFHNEHNGTFKEMAE